MKTPKKRLFAVLLCTMMLTASFTACDKETTTQVTSRAETKKNNNSTPAATVELKEYYFPKFMEKNAQPDMLSNMVYSSFDAKSMVVKVEKQPFEKYKCLEMFLDDYYTFEENGFVGILNKSGDVIVEADKFSSAALVSKNVVKFSYSKDSGRQDKYFDLNNQSSGILDDYKVSEDSIKIKETYDEKNEKNVYDISLDGKSIYQKQWDSVEKIELSDVVTSRKPNLIYKTSSMGEYYFVTFDQYYNVKIYEGAYALIRLKVGNVYGECYVLDADDYGELNNMITSFGSEDYVTKPSSTETLDFIQIVFGLNTKDQVEVTISSDGYCLTDTLTYNDQPANKYFSVLDKETFVDLVNWVGSTLSKEYE